MNASKCLITAGILAAVVIICLAGERPAANEQNDAQAVVEGNNQFALELYARLRGSEGNLFFSPYSISTALAMTYSGARGATAAQMAQVLHFPVEDGKALDGDKLGRPLSGGERRILNNERIATAFGELQKGLKKGADKKGYELSMTNALWGQKGYDFLDGFLEFVETNYGGRLSEVDFVAATEKARATINAWVEKKTKGKIKELIKPGVLNAMTRLVLTNAIYFKGAWAAPFKEAATHPAPFTLAGGKKVDVPMMNQSDKFKYAETEMLQALELPYAENEMSMIILLPKESDGLRDLEEKLTIGRLSDWLGGLQERKVIVSIPKFKMTSQFSMASVLKSMGMTDAFAPGAADFSGMNGRKDLFISAVVHEAYVEVNEEGTEAAAATGVAISLTSMPVDRPPVFLADHPFLFVIRHRQSGSILFIGRAANPKT